jgi:cytochrome c-type biogenesis protein CcmH/NrfF
MTQGNKHHALARLHAMTLGTQLSLTRCQGNAPAMPQAAWQRTMQQQVLDWMVDGGFDASTAMTLPSTKTAAYGRRSLASQRDSIEEYQFTLLRILDAAE